MSTTVLNRALQILETSGEPSQPILLSATRVKMYLQCPRQYRFRYVDEIPTILTGALAFGQVIHQVLHNLQQWSLSHGEKLHESVAWFEFSRLWDEIVTTHDPLFKNPRDVEEYATLAKWMLAGYVEANCEKPPPILLEFPFTTALQNDETGRDYLLRGVIDRIDSSKEGLTIVDYKTGKRKPSPRQLQEDLQLTIYAFAVTQLFGQGVEQIVYYHLRDQSELVTERTADTLQSLADTTLTHVAERIATASFAPSPGYYCRFCDYRDLCQGEGGVNLSRYESRTEKC